MWIIYWKIVKKIKGGYSVKIGKNDGFLPFSLSNFQKDKEYEGEKFKFIVKENILSYQYKNETNDLACTLEIKNGLIIEASIFNQKTMIHFESLEKEIIGIYKFSISIRKNFLLLLEAFQFMGYLNEQNSSPLKIVFFGTPELARSVLAAVADSPAFRVLGAVCQPDTGGS